jgi:hypothetical protein
MLMSEAAMSQSWVKSALPPLAGPLPAWVVIPIPFQIFSITSVWMWTITLTTVFVAAILRSKGRSLLWVIRNLRTSLRGRRIEARSVGYRRATRMDVAIDEFDFEVWRSEQ